jgi:hypothetical protein
MQGRQNSMPCILFYSQSLHKQRLKIVALSKISHPPLLTSIHQNALLLCKRPCLLLSCHKTVKLVITPPSNYPHILSVARLPIHVPFYTERLAFLRLAFIILCSTPNPPHEGERCSEGRTSNATDNLVPLCVGTLQARGGGGPVIDHVGRETVMATRLGREGGSVRPKNRVEL